LPHPNAFITVPPIQYDFFIRYGRYGMKEACARKRLAQPQAPRPCRVRQASLPE
jgi:hypothetical protein